jgi:CRISPR/Cas system CSM-associated protein Csm4 (group 5 of RAMP superfamily)
MGSVFMYRTEGPSLDDLVAGLQKLENEGLGEERARGFGQVLISSPIHYQDTTRS